MERVAVSSMFALAALIVFCMVLGGKCGPLMGLLGMVLWIFTRWVLLLMLLVAAAAGVALLIVHLWPRFAVPAGVAVLLLAVAGAVVDHVVTAPYAETSGRCSF